MSIKTLEVELVGSGKTHVVDVSEGTTFRDVLGSIGLVPGKYEAVKRDGSLLAPDEPVMQPGVGNKLDVSTRMMLGARR